jgi:hypothetical protein
MPLRRMLFIAAFCLALGSSADVLMSRPQDEPDRSRQPATCDNAVDNRHKCECEHAQNCDPTDPKDKERHQYMSKKCSTYCRPKACRCANACNSQD